MFKSKIVFVVGAGASNEALLPTSKELVGKIAEKLNIKYEHGYKPISGSDLIPDAIQRPVPPHNNYRAPRIMTILSLARLPLRRDGHFRC
jgi:hypothetical protein